MEPILTMGDYAAGIRRRLPARSAAVFGVAFAALAAGTSRDAFASTGCTAINSGNWLISVSETNQNNATKSVSIQDNFTSGDQISFVIEYSLSATSNNTFTSSFTGALANGGTASISQNHPTGTFTLSSGSFSATTGTGTLTLTVKEQGNDTSSVFVQSISCTAAASSSTPTDSQNLHSLQIAATQSVAAISGQAITGAVEGGIDDAFNAGTSPFTLGSNGLFLNFAAEPQPDPATQEALDALAYAGNGGKSNMVYKTPPPAPSIESAWSAWADLRGTGFDQSSAGSHEEQINVTGGIGKKLSPDLLVGLFTGYENFSFTMASIAGKMTGDGGTVGTYAAWHYADHWRADAMLGWTDMAYNGTAGTASGEFHGSRWLGAGGFTGTYRYAGFVNEPSARIYTLWERDNAYTDSLGTAQPANNFSASRVSAGDKVSYPWQATANLSVVPYLGLYTDFHFSTSSALPVGVPFVGIKDGWSERVTSGVTLSNGRAGPSLSLGGELGGLGAGYDIWSANARANWPF